MTDVSDRYRRLSGQMRYRRLSGQMEARLAAVTPEQWANPTPCEDWTARDLVGHLVDSSALFLGFVGRSMPDGGSAVDDDPLGAFRHARDAIQAALDDPAVAQAEYEGFAGPSTFEQGVAQFLCGDLVMHQWDLARATGQDEQLDLDEVRGLDAALRPMGDMLRSPGAFGPAVEPAPDADEQTRFLNFIGRRT